MKKNTGFTLIELLITIFIVGILMTIGLPSLKLFMQKNQLIASTNELISALHIARSEAIKLSSRVTICESKDGQTCSSTGSWKNGWIVFVDANGDKAGTGAVCSAIGTDCLLRVHSAINDNQLTISGVLDSTGNTINFFTFTARGVSKDAANTPRSGKFNLCSLNDNGKTIGSRAVVLSISGRVRVSDNPVIITQCPPSP